MRILEIEKLFESEDTLDKVIEKIKDDVENIDYWSGVRKDNLTDNPEEITKALNELSGDYSNLRIVLGIADTELGNREVRKYNAIKMQLEKDDVRFTSQIDSATKKEASAYVGSYRRIYNIIKAYVEACDKHIITLQSILKKWERDYNNT